MSQAPDQLIVPLVHAAGARLLVTANRLDDSAMREPSLLPGWTRAHVLVHLARNADGMRNLLLWARTGQTVRMYPSAAVRAADINSAPQRSFDVLISDLTASIERFLIDLDALAVDGWAQSVMIGPAEVDNPPRPATDIPKLRLTETEIHHIDLDAGYRFNDMPSDVAAVLFAMTRGRVTSGEPSFVVDGGPSLGDDKRRWTVASTGHEPPGLRVVSGTPAMLLGWLSGRTGGAGCTVNDGGALPPLGAFG